MTMCDWCCACQVCSAGSRLIVQESIADCLVAKIKERLTHFRVGDSLDKVKGLTRQIPSVVSPLCAHGVCVSVPMVCVILLEPLLIIYPGWLVHGVISEFNIVHPWSAVYGYVYPWCVVYGYYCVYPWCVVDINVYPWCVVYGY